MMAIKKNLIENGSRAKNLGENPHSKGQNFSLSNKNFWLTLLQSNNRIKAKHLVTNIIVIINLNIN